MKTCLSIKALLIVSLVILCACSKSNSQDNGGNPPDPPPPPPPVSKQVRVFERNYMNYALFRIPALVKANNGTLLLFAEARKLASSGDKGDIDLVLKRSTDGGKTWSNMIMVWDDGGNTCGNPVPVVDKETGTIHLLMTRNNERVFTTKSTDNGLTWAPPKEITSSVKPDGWGFYATGPVHGIQISEGPYKGRLVIPSYATVIENNVRKDHSFMLYSNDKGETWKLGDLTRQDKVGECTVVELTGGRLMLSMRSIYPYRTVATSEDGGHTWSDNRAEKNLIDPLCQASLLGFRKGTDNILFFSNPASAQRENMTIKMSMDEGVSWKKKYTVYTGPSAYSDMVMLDDNTIGIVFESGITSPHGHILFDQVSVTDIK